MMHIELTFKTSNVLTENRRQHLKIGLAKGDFAILTAENPNGQQTNSHTNNEALRNLKNELEKLKLYYVEILGCYEEIPEHSLFVCGANFATICDLANEFNQESFIYSSFNESTVGLYEKDVDKFKCTQKCSRGEINCGCDPDKGFTRYHNLTFSFNFSEVQCNYQCDSNQESDQTKLQSVIDTLKTNAISAKNTD